MFILQWLSDITSRRECNINPSLDTSIKKPLTATTPYLAANMNAISGKRMAEAMATYGWLACLPQDMSRWRKEAIVDHLANVHHQLLSPICITNEEESVIVVKQLAQKKSLNAVFLKNNHGSIIWYYTKEYLNQFPETEKVELSNIPPLPIESMTERFDETKLEEYYNYMVEENKDFLLFKKSYWDNEVKYGVLSRKHAIRLSEYQPALNIKNKLDVILTYGMNQINNDANNSILDELMFFYKEKGITQFLIDTAHWSQKGMVDAITKVRNYFNKALGQEKAQQIIIIAWNVCTAKATRMLLDAWADGIKVGIWPWAMCSTRMQTGVWRPQFSAVMECAEEARKTNNWVIADWWIKHTRDVCLALAAGASYVMFWTVLAWTFESVAELKYDLEGKAYKENFGMASVLAVKERNKDISPFQQAKKMRYQEGISSSYIYLQEWLSTVWEIIDHFTTGLQSSMTYVWARNLEQFYNLAEIGIQTPNGYVEWTPHWKIVWK